MISHVPNRPLGGSLAVLLTGFLLGVTIAPSQEKGTLNLARIPKHVMETLNAKFPRAEIQKWTREKEDGDIVVYDIEFRQDAQKYEADIKSDGTILNWEKEVPAKDLSRVVIKAVQTKYPNSELREVMAITMLKDRESVLEGYEIILGTSDGKEVEVTVSPGGKILEDSGEKK